MVLEYKSLITNPASVIPKMAVTGATEPLVTALPSSGALSSLPRFGSTSPS